MRLDCEAMERVVVVGHDSSVDHVGPRGHPESPERLGAVSQALSDPILKPTLVHIDARPATDTELALVHRISYIHEVRGRIEQGADHLDPDTYVSGGSWTAATHAAGAGLSAIEHLDENQHLEGAFVAVRPPGHHAISDRAMGFCLLNNIAVAAATLAERGERVLIIDWDVHHGNGTQAIFWNDPRVSFVSLHEANNYPYSGRLDERGGHDARGTTTNLALPSGATGDVYREAFKSVIEPIVSTVEPTWLLVSAGFDTHHRDPLSNMGLTAGDYADLTSRTRELAPDSARVILFLEGGYDLDALRDSVRSSVAGLAGIDMEEQHLSSGGPGIETVVEASGVVTSRR